MLVCQRWHSIMLTTPGIHSQLWIRRSTQRKDIEAAIRGSKSLLDVIVDMNDEKHGKRLNARNFHASFMAAAQEAPRWHSLELVSLPPHGEYMDLQIMQPLERLESFKISAGCNLGSSLEPLMIAVSSTATPFLTSMEAPDADTILYLVRPACLHVFHSLRTLKVSVDSGTSQGVW